jgi:hypothetical protein
VELSDQEQETGLIKKAFRDEEDNKIYLLKNGKELTARRFWKMYYR